MTDRLYIDEVPIFETYGVFVAQYNYKSVAQFPKFKAFTINDWAEEDGVEVDLSAPKFESRQITIKFFAEELIQVTALIELLSDGAYHEFNMTEIGKTLKLRYVSSSSTSLFIKSGSFSITLADDFPFRDYEYLAATPLTEVWQQGYKIDDVDLSSYGIWVLNGTDAELLKQAAVKPNLTINTSAIDGVVYDAEVVKYKAKNANLKFLINAPDRVTFWRNYNAFFYNLTQPNEREIEYTIQGVTKKFSCYYSSSEVSKLDVLTSGRVWCEFNVTLVINKEINE
ncbi:MAG: hypothetical protein R3Y50_06050 [Rikenellaceae bacterium]